MKSYWVYILASQRNGTLYIGVTNNILRRIYEHKAKYVKGFTTIYNVTRLVHVEEFYSINEAIHSEKCIKKWKRAWKLRLIEEHNPNWDDLYDSIL